jgi:hypothetical protein
MVVAINDRMEAAVADCFRYMPTEHLLAARCQYTERIGAVSNKNTRQNTLIFNDLQGQEHLDVMNYLAILPVVLGKDRLRTLSFPSRAGMPSWSILWFFVVYLAHIGLVRHLNRQYCQSVLATIGQKRSARGRHE